MSWVLAPTVSLSLFLKDSVLPPWCLLVLSCPFPLGELRHLRVCKELWGITPSFSTLYPSPLGSGLGRITPSFGIPLCPFHPHSPLGPSVSRVPGP